MRRLYQSLGILLLAALSSSALLANRRASQTSGRPASRCACQCNTDAGHLECTKMCELPKYEARWWATSCHRGPSLLPRKDPESRPQPSKENDIETARR